MFFIWFWSIGAQNYIFFLFSFCIFVSDLCNYLLLRIFRDLNLTDLTFASIHIIIIATTWANFNLANYCSEHGSLIVNLRIQIVVNFLGFQGWLFKAGFWIIVHWGFRVTFFCSVSHSLLKIKLLLLLDEVDRISTDFLTRCSLYLIANSSPRLISAP